MTASKRLTLCALFSALCYVLPFFTAQLPLFGKMLCPMHIPVLLCGYLCGWQYGAIVGLTAPLLRALTLGSPVLFPMAIAMAFELCTYGVLTCLFDRLLPKKTGFLYLSLILSMIGGRMVWGAVRLLLAEVQGTSFPLSAFFAGAVTESLPGIVLQLVLIPPLVEIIRRRNA